MSGKLALAGVDLRAPASVWLDAVYAIVVDAPNEQLQRIHEQITMQAGRLRPDRDSWGLDPDQAALTNKITKLDNKAPTVAQRGGSAK